MYVQLALPTLKLYTYIYINIYSEYVNITEILSMIGYNELYYFHQIGYTPLYLAVYNNHLDLALMLAERGADLDLTDGVSSIQIQISMNVITIYIYINIYINSNLP